MSRRFLLAVALAAVVAVVMAMLQSASFLSLGSNAVMSVGSTPKTPWGEPDLQGIWTSEYQTPLQRPTEYASKEFFTDAEIAELDKRRAAAQTFSDRVAPRGSEQDVAGAYGDEFQVVKRTGRRTSLITDPPNGRIPPLTPEAQKRRQEIRAYQLALLQATDVCKKKLPACAGGSYGPPSPKRTEVPPHYLTVAINRSDGPEDRGLAERCLGAVLPDFGGLRRVVQSPGSVAIYYETGQGQGWQRIIPIDGSPHLPSSVRLRFGDSRGRWEGNTLVVDVTNFTPKTDFEGARENLHLVERWTRSDANTIEYMVTIEDPTTWTKPWTVKQEMTKQDEEANRIYDEPRCHEGNYGMTGLLMGARTEEKAFAEGRGPDPATRCNVICLPELNAAPF